LRPTDIATQAEAIIAEVERVIVGKNDSVRLAVMTLVCNGHLLIEDIPGVGKTTLAKALAKAIGGEFRRIQFTPDLLPADITGSSVFNQRNTEFEFRPGPIFGNVVLVDEINRATPKTQSSLLEAMEERQATVDGITRDLPRPFFVIATQNTVEMTGTYPLPEAQLDRFFAKVSLGYPARDAELEILTRQQITHPIETVREVIDLCARFHPRVHRGYRPRYARELPSDSGRLAAGLDLPDPRRPGLRSNHGERIRSSRRRQGGGGLGAFPPGYRPGGRACARLERRRDHSPRARLGERPHPHHPLSE
jgi:hypothetical protein